MGHSLKSSRLALLAVVVLALSARPARAGIHFLALDDFPHELQKCIAERQHAIRAILKSHKQLAPALAGLHENKGPSLHVSIVRFKELSKQEEASYAARIRKVVHHFKFSGHGHHSYDLASKVNGGQLEVLNNGWIIFRLKPSQTMTRFANKVIAGVGHHGQTDFPQGAHISVMKIDPKKVDIQAVRKALQGHVTPLVCKHFGVHTFRLMHSDNQHHYSTVKGGTFHVSKGK